MIVVAIVGILATLAVVGYRRMIQSSHVAEATGMVTNIRVAQESYHGETQTYANISPTLESYYPNAPVYQHATAWGGPCGACNAGISWGQLPVHVDGPVLFGYATMAGPAGTPPVNPANGIQLGWPATPTSDWYTISAAGDLDGNPAINTTVYGSSWTNQLTVYHDGN
jgi:type IV pilus assembly protein PilA